MKRLLTAGLLGGLFAVPLIGASAGSNASATVSVQKIDVGSQPSYTFRQAPVNAMGVNSLEDLRGKPVLVEFWGTN